MASVHRLLTVPNALSAVRLLCVPVFLYLLFGRHDRLAAAVLLGVLGATDWVDGYIARHFDQVSTIGKVLDPVADRVLLGVSVVAILIAGAVPAWIAWLVIVREVGVSAGMLLLATLGARRIDVQWTGKAGTFALMWAFPLFLASHATDFPWANVVGALAWGFALVGLLLSWYAAVTYIPLGRLALEQGQQARR